MCLASNVYHEARGESLEGQYAVAKVTLNRLQYPEYPKTLCGVVFQPRQFSWTQQYQHRHVDNTAWVRAKDVAYRALTTEVLPGFSATHYHSNKVKPKWDLEQLGTIGNHIFYKQKPHNV